MKIEKKRRVVITGLGTVNPTGNTVAESWAAVKAGRCAVGPITAFDTTDFKVKLAAEVKDFDPAERIDRREARKMARFTQFAVAAADEAIHDSGIALENIDHTRFGVILSSGIGGLPTIEEEHTRGQQRGFEKVSPYFVPMSIGNMAAGQVAIRFGLQGMCSCPTTACAGGTNAIGDAFHRIRDGYEDRMLCGGSESCISPLGVGGFASMKALCTADDPARASIPFDARRSGFVMGEGSGVLLLEELETAKERGAKIYAEVVGYGANCDDVDLIASSENVSLEDIADVHAGNIVQTELTKGALRSDVCFVEVAFGCLVDLLGAHFAKAKLDCLIAVGLDGFLLHDGAGAGFDDGYRNDLAVFIKQLGHAQFLANDTFLHLCKSSCKGYWLAAGCPPT